jgi:hypothetical protein
VVVKQRSLGVLFIEHVSSKRREIMSHERFLPLVNRRTDAKGE